MIKPTNGRVVLFQPGPNFPGQQIDPAQKLTAHVVHVYNDRMVNLLVFDSYGVRVPVTSVQLLQDDDKPMSENWAEWMVFQKGQAAKTEALEAKVAGATS